MCLLQSSDLIVGLHSAFSKYSDAEKQSQIKKVRLWQMIISPTFLLRWNVPIRQTVSSNWRLQTKARKRWRGLLTWRSPVLSTRAKPNQRRTSPLSLQTIRCLIWLTGRYRILAVLASWLILDSGRSPAKRHLWLESWKQRATWCLPLSLTPSWRYHPVKRYYRTPGYWFQPQGAKAKL